jgi:hypothetical protein
VPVTSIGIHGAALRGPAGNSAMPSAINAEPTSPPARPANKLRIAFAALGNWPSM